MGHVCLLSAALSTPSDSRVTFKFAVSESSGRPEKKSVRPGASSLPLDPEVGGVCRSRPRHDFLPAPSSRTGAAALSHENAAAWKGGRVHGKDEASEGESVCQKGRSSVRNRTWEAPVMAIGCRAAQHAEALPGPWCPPAGELHLAMTPFEGSEFCTPALDELR